jgi:predicted phage baseplate assembly protein
VQCRDEQRRHQVRRRGLNGLDYLEVSEDQRVLTVYFLGKAPAEIDQVNVRIDGGIQVRDIEVVDVRFCRQDDPELDDCMKLVVDRPGDFSTYTLRVVEVDGRRTPTGPFRGFDPRYAALPFSFKIGCASDLACRPDRGCAEAPLEEPEINYLAKDYASFRRLILDRLALNIPDWRERHVPDVGIAVVELLAYVGDRLSYYQDAVATEAYLGTARRRVSMRRHARLMDYQLHEGCNARAWVTVETGQTIEDLDPDRMLFLTRLPGEPFGTRGVVDEEQLRGVPASQYQVFEPVERERALAFYKDHNLIRFYTWGDRQCCLSKGATSATLRSRWERVEPPAEVKDKDDKADQQYGSSEAASTSPKAKRKAARDERAQPYPPQTGGDQHHARPPALVHSLRRLRPGDVLIFEEVLGSKTGAPADADPGHRHAVRLTSVTFGEDTLYADEEFADRGTPIVEIAWHAADALPFPLCLSAVVAESTDDGTECHRVRCTLRTDVSVARGNIVLVDHGRTVRDEVLGTVEMDRVTETCDEESRPSERVSPPAPFCPSLGGGPLTFVRPLDSQAAASHVVTGDSPSPDVQPAILLNVIPPAPDGTVSLFQPEDLANPAAVMDRVKTLGDSGAVHLRGSLQSDALRGGERPADARARESQVALVKELRGMLEPWSVRPDLLASGAGDAHFIVEIDDDGRAQLRFGDDDLGRRPASGATFLATYRNGNGPDGNVSADAIAHVVFVGSMMSGTDLTPRNPLPSLGGTPPEPMEDARLLAPFAARAELARAITAEDYALLAERRFPRVQRAAAALAWTGSRYEATVAIDERGSADADPDLLLEIERDLAKFRRIGHDVAVTPARQVPLDIEIVVCVAPAYLSAHVKAALLERFSNRVAPDGRLGFFHPDNLSFGQSMYLSALVAAAQALEGVESVQVTKLQRLFEGPARELDTGVLQLGPFEVARADNDPNFPERGRIAFIVRGGR